MITLDRANKVFLLPHDKKRTLRQRFVHLFQKGDYERLYALRDVSLDVKEGEFLGVIGRNGSGKSTLLKLVAKVLDPTSGSVSIKGDVAPFLELGVGFQGDLTVKDNIVLYGALLGMDRRQIADKYDWIVEFSGLERFVDAKLKNLSSGMQVRLGFSITVSVESPILLVDEVLAVGDIEFQQKCYDTFDAFRDKGKTMLFVSHDLKAIEEICDRVILLEDGRVIEEGSCRDVLQAYRAISPLARQSGDKRRARMQSKHKI
ncbi:MAG: ABC transporter ATP-binding protein [Phycisphaerae bacterium]|jgi:lipopolysaccharide transport system ATP-binding protein|nr:ABC transporter ATP-binding protein [Phycisphaerae bacterium]